MQAMHHYFKYKLVCVCACVCVCVCVCLCMCVLMCVLIKGTFVMHFVHSYHISCLARIFFFYLRFLLMAGKHGSGGLTCLMTSLIQGHVDAFLSLCAALIGQLSRSSSWYASGPYPLSCGQHTQPLYTLFLNVAHLYFCPGTFLPQVHSYQLQRLCLM